MDIGESNYHRYLGGDDEGLTLIIKEYKDGLILYINSYVNNVIIAEELMEETFFKIAVKRPKFLGKCSFKTWLYAIARNVTMDHFRKSAKYSGIPLENLENRLCDAADTKNEYISIERKLALHKALTELKPEYSQILWLIYFEGFSNEEAALIMKKSKRQIENLVSRARRSLKIKLEKEGFEHEKL